MEVFCDAREISERFGRYIVDLRRLFLFHGLACGEAENFCDLAVKLEESRPLRLDLPALLRHIRDLECGAISPDEMLTAVALASGGELLVEGRAACVGLMRTLGMLQMMLAGVGSWAEANAARAALSSDGEASTAETAGGGGERIFAELAIEELRLQLAEVVQRLSALEPLVQQALAALQVPRQSAPLHAEEIVRSNDREDVRVAETEPEAEDPWRWSEAGQGWRSAATPEDAVPEGAEELWTDRADSSPEPRFTVESPRAGARSEVALWRQEEVEYVLPLRTRRTESYEPGPRGYDTGQQSYRSTPEARSRTWRTEHAERVQTGKRLRWDMAAALLLVAAGTYATLRPAPERESPLARRDAQALLAANARADGGKVPLPGPAASPQAWPTLTTPLPKVKEPERTVTQRPAARRPEKALAERRAAPAVKAAKVQRPGTAGIGRPTALGLRRVSGEARQAERSMGSRASAATKANRSDAETETGQVRQQGKFLYVAPEVMQHHLLSARKPVVPANVKGEPVSARVVLNTFIAKDGRVSRTDVLEGPPKLAESAMAAVSWWRYRPFLLRGKPADVVTPVTVQYALAR